MTDNCLGSIRSSFYLIMENVDFWPKNVEKMVGKCVGMHSGHILKNSFFGQKMVEKHVGMCRKTF